MSSSVSFPCEIDNFSVKKEITLKIVAPKRAVEGKQLDILKNLVGEEAYITLEPTEESKHLFEEEEIEEEEKDKKKDEQFSFLSPQCPDCDGYDCQVFDTLAACNTCKKEFALPPEFHKISEEQIRESLRIAKELYTATVEGQEFIEKEEFLTWLQETTDKDFPKDIYEDGLFDLTVPLKTLTQADFETIIEKYNQLVQAEVKEEQDALEQIPVEF